MTAGRRGYGDTRMSAKFSVHISDYQQSRMLNICDRELLGRHIGGADSDAQEMHISESYYGGDTVSREEAARMLQESSIINMVGRDIVSLAVELGIGSEEGAKIIAGVPFMLVFKM